MGQYSLENYEKYQTKKCRPKFLHITNKKLYLFSIEQSACEKENGRYEFSIPDFNREDCVWLLVLNFNKGKENIQNVDETENFIRQAGSFYKNYQKLGGVLIKIPQGMTQKEELLWQAYADAFTPLWKIADSQSEKLVRWLQDKNMPFGLCLMMEGDKKGNEIEIREFLAENHLQRMWEKAPVYALISNALEVEKSENLCKGWHVTAADKIKLRGAQLIPKRITFPQAVSSEGAMPVRVWWDNCGDSPLYDTYSTQLCLQGKEEAEITLSDKKINWPIGDSTYNEIITLPHLEEGIYAIYIRVLNTRGEEVPLSVETPLMKNRKGSWYYLDKIEIDLRPRPELFTAWNDYYPEGYYPLEDPKQPEEEKKV